MNPDAFESLVLSQTYLQAAWASGSGRDAVALGYSAVDAAFSALIAELNRPVEKNHSKKINIVQGVYARVYRDSGTTEQGVRDFYDKWQAVRYGTVVVTPKEGIHYLRLAGRIVDAIVGKIAQLTGQPAADIEEQVLEQVLGAKSSKIDEAVSEYHDHILWGAEVAAESSEGGSKMATKLLHSSNFCRVLVSAADPITQDIVVNSELVARTVTDFYGEFVRLVDTIQMARMSKGLDMDNALNFSLFVRLGYYGMSATEVFDDFRTQMREAGHPW